MKLLKIFPTFLCTLFIFCNITILTSEYKYHYVALDLKPQNNTPNISLTAHATLVGSTNSHYKNHYPTPQQLAIVTNWMRQFYPDTTALSAPPKKPSPLQKTSINTASQSSPIPEITTHQKYSATSITKLEDQFFIYQQSPEWDTHAHIINQRVNALEQIKNGNQQSSTKNYAVSEKMRRYCNTHAINIQELEQCQGDILQRTIHDEFADITKKSARIWHKNTYPKAFKKSTGIVADFTDAGVAFNKANDVRKALVLADACWMILDCIQAAGEGLAEGVYHTIDDITHPVRTIQSIAESIATCGYYIGKVAIEVGELSYLVIAEHPEKTYQKLDEWSDTFAVIYAGIQAKCTTLKTRDVIKETVSFGMQLYATPKALHDVGRLFKYAHKNAIKLAKNISHSAKSNTLTTPEGIIIRIADSTAEFMKNEQTLSSIKPLQAANMSEFFQHPFGQMLLKKSKKTPYRYQNPIYQLTENIPGTNLKKNHFYYLDRLHGDHLEIFDQAYQCSGVYNLDGTFNQIKYDLARKNGRNIRNLIKGK